ncbi:MAG: lamin tail domain-containing protein [archaeon]
MKNIKLIPTLLMAILVLPMALAQVAITEIMYAPNQTTSETDTEWIELHNSGEKINLTGWKLNGNPFDPIVLNSQQYVVIARELIDTDDADTDSFQSVWGTDIFAVDGSFTLSNTGGTVELTDELGTVIDSFTYTPEIGGAKNGKTIEKTDSGWNESLIYGGTPGEGLFIAPIIGSMEDEVAITLDLENSIPEVQSASYDATKIYATVYDANGLDDILEVYVELVDQVINMIQEATTYKADLPELQPGEYEATVYARDAFSTGNKTITITIESIASMNLIQEALSFTDMKAGEVKNNTLEIQNNGNVDLQIDFAVVGDIILQEGLECYDTDWKTLTQCIVTVLSGETQSLNLRLSVPEGTKAGQYTGKLQTTATVQ